MELAMDLIKEHLGKKASKIPAPEAGTGSREKGVSLNQLALYKLAL